MIIPDVEKLRKCRRLPEKKNDVKKSIAMLCGDVILQVRFQCSFSTVA